ncbi:hypothetical protein ACFPZ0_12820 [Streptomonospora nanhaiensis]|uniref:hypothetical protein n=1 Tax=Streptomonospora nanhaiensis TaxID=1323731 RepID=UPI001C391066|nr:hypothetical protein [Streptomonospora nanhaiensis]MBV2366649.1 hypothetical protein [Streptomonospora nanhaiensis]MBX9389207.1 hypothetical protein [Streptomonospora nanhaiensis]
MRHPTERSHGAAVVDGAKRTLESDTRRLSYETARSMAAAARAREALATTERVLGDALRAARAGRSSYREFEVDDRAVQGALEAVRADPATAHHAASYSDLLDRYSEVRLARAKEMRELRAAAERIPPEVGVPGHEDFDAAFVVKTTVTYLDSRLTREVSLAPLAGAERQQDPVSIVKDAKRFLTREIVALVDQRASIAQMADTARAVLKSDGVKAEAPAPEHRPDRAAAADAPRPPRDAAASPQREPKRTVIQPARPRRTPPGGARRAHNHR